MCNNEAWSFEHHLRKIVSDMDKVFSEFIEKGSNIELTIADAIRLSDFQKKFDELKKYVGVN
ncbi:hypothetical protein LCGC14_0225140 [marine sediment metagenome]|uniref:Uncharacterized protein n=1 Tax=marine sediment metagenome TaxID=412755 RepID=A0A0F9UCM6_9ZZZZ